MDIIEFEEQNFRCDVCEKDSNSLESFHNHVISKEHVENCAILFKYQIASPVRANSQTFHCNLCNIACTGEASYTAHLEGAKHKKKEKAKILLTNTSTKKGKEKKEMPKEPVTWEEFLKFKEPLIGLEFVSEIHNEYDELPTFKCDLCSSTFDNNIKFSHLVGVKHRFKAIKAKSDDWANKIKEKNIKRSELAKILTLASRSIEEKEGRQKIKLKVIKTEKECTSQSDDNNDDDDDSSITDNIECDSNIYTTCSHCSEKTHVRLSEEQEKFVVEKQADKLVTTKDEADFAMKISNSLVQQVIEYHTREGS